MARPEGLPKTGGRKKGTPNKRSEDLKAVLEANGVDVVKQLSELLPRLDDDRKVGVLLHLMSYMYPKRKAVEVTANLSENEPVVIITLPSNGREAIS